MRKDISKLLCETPRYNRGSEDYRSNVRSKVKQVRDIEEDLPYQQSMRRPYHGYYGRKEFSEYFPPLKRFLAKSVGRGWNNVYSEICENMNRDSTVHYHVFMHLLRDFVELKPIFINGVPHRPGSYGSGPYEISGLYVDENGILRDNDSPKIKERRERKKEKERVLREDRRKFINDFEEYRLINGIWYHVWYKSLRPGETGFDLILKRDFTLDVHGFECYDLVVSNGHRGKTPLGWNYPRLCIRKLQISKKEIKEEGLE